MKLSISTLRSNIYRIIDHILATGQPVILERKGVELKISLAAPSAPRSKKTLRSLKKVRTLNVLRCKPEELLGMSWESEWKADDLP